MNQAEQQLAGTGPIPLAGAGGAAPPGVELRHLRYFVAVADAGTFTHAAQRMYIAQPTLSQQIRRLEQIVGTPLLHRRREGVRLTTAGTVLLEESRTVLSQVDHGMSRTRQAAGLGRLRLRVIIPPVCRKPSPWKPPPGCDRPPMPPGSASRGWRYRSMPGTRRSASAGPTPAWAG